MFYYGYIDESGTKSDQQFMTVALVLFDGKRAAARLQTKILDELYPKRGLATKGGLKSFQIHFADMNDAERRSVARIVKQSQLSVFISYYQHTSVKEHDERFYIYSRLVQLVINAALQRCHYLNIAIAKQGGWQKYQKSFLGVLGSLLEGYSERGEFRKTKYEFASSSNPGIQIADFYAGVFRSRLLAEKRIDINLDYDWLAQQIKSVSIFTV